MMGHSDISVTMNTYTHLGLEEAVSETNRLQQLESARKEQAALDLPSADEAQPFFCCLQGAQYGILQGDQGHWRAAKCCRQIANYYRFTTFGENMARR